MVGRTPLLALCALVGGCIIQDADLEAWATADSAVAPTDPVSVLLVVDTSASMAEENAALGIDLETLEAALALRPGSRVAITTSSVDVSSGASSGIDPGEAGTAVGAVINTSTPQWTQQLRQTLLCDAVYWGDSSLPSDPTTDCSDGRPPDAISRQYLDCLCGSGKWEDTPQGSGNEEPLEAALLAVCRASPDPDDACADPLSPYAASADLRVNDWWTPSETVHVLLVSDEGDNSRRMGQGDVDATGPYLDVLEDMAARVTVSAVMPTLDDTTGSVVCGAALSPAPQTWSVERVQDLAEQTGGVYRSILEETAEGCQMADIGEALDAWGQVLSGG